MKQITKMGRITTAVVLTAAIAFGVGCNKQPCPCELKEQAPLAERLHDAVDRLHKVSASRSKKIDALIIENKALTSELEKLKAAQPKKATPAEKPPVAPGVQTYPGKSSSISG